MVSALDTITILITISQARKLTELLPQLHVQLKRHSNVDAKHENSEAATAARSCPKFEMAFE
jgi:hypothetical protein